MMVKWNLSKNHDVMKFQVHGDHLGGIKPTILSILFGYDMMDQNRVFLEMVIELWISWISYQLVRSFFSWMISWKSYGIELTS